MNKEKKFLDYDRYNLDKIVVKQNNIAPDLVLNLDLVVKNPGIYPLESLKELNQTGDMIDFENLPTPEEIEFDNFDKYMAPFQDEKLKEMVKKMGFKYASSTSGISGILTHFFYKLTNFKSPHFYGLTEPYEREPLKFMMFQRKPSQIMLRKEGNMYTISKTSIFTSINEIVLMKMGKYMEKLFTTSPSEFNKKYKKHKTKIQYDIDQDYFNFVGK